MNTIHNKKDLQEHTLSVVTTTIEKMVRNNRDDGMPTETYLLDSPVGGGKTYSAIKTIQESDYSCLFFCETVNRVKDIAEQIRGLAMYSDMPERMYKETMLDCFLRMREEHTRIVLTHATLRTLVSKQYTKDDVFEPFDAVIIDELYRSFQSYIKGIDEVSLTIAHLYPLILTGNEEAKKLADYIVSLQKTNEGITLLTGGAISDISYDKILEDLPDKENAEDTRLLLTVLKNVEKNVLYAEKRNTGLWLVSAANLLPNTVSFLILSDGLKRDGLTHGLAMWGRKPKVIELPRGNWSNYEFIYTTNRQTGKYSIEHSLDEVASQILIQEKDNYYNPEKKALVVLPKVYVDEMREILPEDYCITHYGRHKGTNEFSDCDDVFILTLHYKPPAEVSVNALARIEPDCQFNPKKFEDLKLPLLSVYQDLNQASGRANRNAEEYEDRHIRVFTVMMEHPKSDRELMLKWLAEDYPGITIIENGWMQNLPPNTVEKISIWKPRMLRMPDGKLPSLGEKGIPVYQLLKDKRHRLKWKQVRKTKWVRHLYRELGIYVNDGLAFNT